MAFLAQGLEWCWCQRIFFILYLPRVIALLVMVKSNAVGQNIVFINDVQRVVKGCLARLDRYHTAAFAHSSTATTHCYGAEVSLTLQLGLFDMKLLH